MGGPYKYPNKNQGRRSRSVGSLSLNSLSLDSQTLSAVLNRSAYVRTSSHGLDKRTYLTFLLARELSIEHVSLLLEEVVNERWLVSENFCW